jgi:D-3-phosphoglycerate dehydrogenase
MKILVYSGPRESAGIVKNILGSRFAVNAVESVPEKLLPEFERCTVFLDASMKVPITAETITRAKDLKLVVTATTGASHIDNAALDKRGVPLLTLKGRTAVLKDITAAAEHSWLLLMACARRLRPAIHNVEAGEWDRGEFPGIMLKDKTLGIIGMGRIGTWMARYARAFGMKIIGYDSLLTDLPDDVKKAGMEELVAASDFITLHVNFTPENKGMISKAVIKKFKDGCIFINTSRGELIDEAALVEGLKSGRIQAVGADVLTGEPDSRSNPLWQYARDHENVIITPHIGGFCPEAVDKVVAFSCERILEYFR